MDGSATLGAVTLNSSSAVAVHTTASVQRWQRATLAASACGSARCSPVVPSTCGGHAPGAAPGSSLRRDVRAGAGADEAAIDATDSRNSTSPADQQAAT